jgi:hypothetical protein
MTARKTNHTAFEISSRPVVPFAAEEQPYDASGSGGLPRVHGPPILFAIARDPRTIFTYWNIDWPSIFEKTVPVDRQVYLRLYRADGLEERSVAVEPMVGVHYVTISGAHSSYRVEIGYYQPADVWHSVATSNQVMMPADRIAGTADVDLATIPFHVNFQQLVDLFGAANNDALATVISRFQKRANSKGHKELGAKERTILRKVDVSLSEIAATRRAFNETDCEKLRKRTDALLGFGSTSPSREFKGDWASAGS